MTDRTYDIVLLPGDGIGPEVVSAARRVLEAVGERFGKAFTFAEHLIGGAGIDAGGDPFPATSLEACRAADAILLGAVGGPKWDDPTAEVRPEQGLLALRKELALFANLRPVVAVPALADASPLKPALLDGVDMLVVRELTGGIYFGEPRLEGAERAFDTLVYTLPEVERVAHVAFRAAQRRRGVVTSVDKANVLASSRLWRQAVEAIAPQYPDVRLEHQLVDSCAMRLVTNPGSFDVIVTSNMFGDILSDEASILAGSLGLLPSASLGAPGTPGVYEPVHGSAPDIAGQGVANPLAMLSSTAMALRHSLELGAEAAALDDAIATTLSEGPRPRDLGGAATTAAVTEAVIAALGRAR